jgi:hypothetical protein
MEELEDFKKEKLTIDLVWVNIYGILILIPIVLIFGLPYYLLWIDSIDMKNIIDNILPEEIDISALFVF